ncbi:uridylate-specific endoribonuclease D [Bombina bombina]|uniref:uridylate-specific endoribonuclease D n=1 Tax=Bombina bombina TaxID=8345 RepID=UPI00235ADA58|nr:uridylate-specific endoribonuclease D [Bombina bombina]
MKGTIILFCILPCVICGTHLPEPRRSSLFAVTNAEIQGISQQLNAADVNKAEPGDITINLQYKVNSNQTGAGTDYASQKLFSYVNETKLFSLPTYSRFLALLDNYVKGTGTLEIVNSTEVEEQTAFIDEIFKTSIFSILSNFLIAKGYYTSVESFKDDLKEMWFGLYTRSKGPLDSSGFEHVFTGEIQRKKVSGFHNWVQLYLQEKSGQVNYLSYSVNKTRDNFPGVLAFQYKWSSYLKNLGSFFIGSSPEFDVAIYTLCYITRRDKGCPVRLGSISLQIQTHSWTNSFYGNGKRYLASSYPKI